jgi:16S rRNA (adenine1518-N6/adenine1519-N6)-dimethyltransferase
LLSAAEIKKILKDNGLCVNKAMGQNFLISRDKRDKIINLCGIKSFETILEIGPGLGALTECIQPLCERLIAVEKDRGYLSLLNDFFKNIPSIELINSDILEYQIPCLRGKLKVVGNLPYYITSPVIFHLVSQKNCIDSIFITVQKEVARRIIASPGSKDYGILSLSVSYHCQADILLDIEKKAFFPQPEVDSSFIRLIVRKKPLVEVKDEKYLFSVIKAGFNQRRKTLLNALSNSRTLKLDKNILVEVFSKLKFDFRIRAEQLGLREFALLSDALNTLHL